MSMTKTDDYAKEFWITFLTLQGLRRISTWMPPLGLGIGYVAGAIDHSGIAKLFLAVLGFMVFGASLVHFVAQELKDSEGRLADELRKLDIKTSVAQHFTATLLFFGALIHTCVTHAY